MSLFLDDGDIQLHHGDALAVLRDMPSESVHCIVTSPPFWGLRDYGTGSWTGGDEACDHTQTTDERAARKYADGKGAVNSSNSSWTRLAPYHDTCRKCGATRVDQQIGLEETPDAWCARLVSVFREARRVLRNDGVCFIEIGDSYASAALRGVEPSDTTCTQPPGSPDPGSACPDQCGERAASPELRNQHTDQPPPVAPSLLEQTVRGSASSGSGIEAWRAARLASQASTALAGASVLPPASSASAEASPQPLLPPPATSEIGAPHHEHRDASNPGTSGTSDPLAGRTQGTELSRMASQNHTSASLKQKDLVGAPWLLAFALRADGWFLRSEIIWSKPNPMPESVGDRPTKAHSTIFLLTKSARYFYDADAIREEALFGPSRPRDGVSPQDHKLTTGGTFRGGSRANDGDPSAGRNARSVWTISTQPTPWAHFATFPEELVRRCIAAGTSEHGACSECGAPWRRITETTPEYQAWLDSGKAWTTNGGKPDDLTNRQEKRAHPATLPPKSTTTGWEASCAHDDGLGGVLRARRARSALRRLRSLYGIWHDGPRRQASRPARHRHRPIARVPRDCC